MAANRRHLQCINGHYRYRRRWPKGIRAVAQGEFFIRHLGTSSLADALRLRPAVEIEFFSEVDRLSGLVDNAPREISQAEATMLVSRWFAEQIKRDAEYDLTQSIRDREERLAAIEAKGYAADVVADIVGSGDLEPFEDHAASLLAEHGIQADRGSPGFRLAAQLMARADRERWLLSQARLRGGFGYQPSDPVCSNTLKEEPLRKSAPTVGGLIEAFKSDRMPGWSPSSVAAYAPVERVMREVLGSARELSKRLAGAEGTILINLSKSRVRWRGDSSSTSTQGAMVDAD